MKFKVWDKAESGWKSFAMCISPVPACREILSSSDQNYVHVRVVRMDIVVRMIDDAVFFQP